MLHTGPVCILQTNPCFDSRLQTSRLQSKLCHWPTPADLFRPHLRLKKMQILTPVPGNAEWCAVSGQQEFSVYVTQHAQRRGDYNPSRSELTDYR